MPFPYMAAASLAALAGNLDCDHPNMEDQVKDDESERKKSVRFDENGIPVLESVRSVDFESSSSSLLSPRGGGLAPAGSIRLGRVKTTTVAGEEVGAAANAARTPHGYVDGAFASGVTHEIHLDEGCFVLRYSDMLLAVGTPDGLALYETQEYKRVFHIPTSDEVSAIRWLRLEGDSLLPSQRLLSFGCLDGSCFLYVVDNELLEVEGGVSLLHQFRMNGQIRALDCCSYGDISKGAELTIILAVGDSTGRVILLSFDGRLLRLLETVDSEHHSSAVLDLVLQKERGWIASCTKSGLVTVHELKRNPSTGVVRYGSMLWEAEGNGPVIAVTFSHGSGESSRLILAFGGYEKRVSLIDTSVWASFLTLDLDGTINAIAFDRFDRYLAVGCRDKTLSLFDSSTYMRVKSFQTEGWASDLCWKPPPDVLSAGGDGILAVRSKREMVSVLNLQPIELANIHLPSSSKHSINSACLSWNADGHLLIRAVGADIVVADVARNFEHVAMATLSGGAVVKVCFCKAPDMQDRVAAVDESGQLTLFRMLPDSAQSSWILGLKEEASVMVETGIRALTWSPDGSTIALGGKQKRLWLIDSVSLSMSQTIDLEGRIWDIAFAPPQTSPDRDDEEKNISEDVHLVLALGDYTCVALNKSYETSLRFARPRTVRCIAVHPTMPIVVVGDGAGTLAAVDTRVAEMVHEMRVGGRVNTVEFSPMGDYLVVGTDSGRFNLYLSDVEQGTYQFAQEIPSKGFATCAAFSPDGSHLATGAATGSYGIVRLGPFLGIDLVPLSAVDQRQYIGRDHMSGVDTAQLPEWALAEVLYRSGYSPSFLQRHILQYCGGTENELRRLGALLKQYPNAIYAHNRSTNETFFDTALRTRRPMVLKLAVTALVDGTLGGSRDQWHGDHGRNSILTTRLPQQARSALDDIIVNMNPALVAEILGDLVFMKVPYGKPRRMRDVDRREKGSCSTDDPWEDDVQHPYSPPLFSSISLPWSGRSTVAKQIDEAGDKMLTPAVLPLPNLGEMNFLSLLLWNAPPEVFDNVAMGVVLRVLWNDHIGQLFYADFLLFAGFFGCWVALVESIAAKDSWTSGPDRPANGLAVVVFLLNSVYGVKEIIEAKSGRHAGYFRSLWNLADITSLLLVYAFVLHQMMVGALDVLVPLAVLTTFAMTVKFISYLRGFEGTGWLISVLSANFRDVRGFLVILFAILSGFAVVFRVLFSQVEEEAYGSLRRSMLSTFELVTTGNYEPSMLHEAEWNALAVISFVFAVLTVLVIALNALISILADSYARVQENAIANRRKEQAGLIVEYMSLLPAASRRHIEDKTRWFHCLLEVDGDGVLLLRKTDWQGGLNALRKDMQEFSTESRQQQERELVQLRLELHTELAAFRKETTTLLSNLASEMRDLKRAQSRAGITLNGRNVVKAVRAVRSMGKKTAEFIRTESNK